jgi:hypothetical protein
MVIHSIEHYTNRINLLRSRGEVINAKLIKKLERKVRKLKEEGA